MNNIMCNNKKNPKKTDDNAKNKGMYNRLNTKLSEEM